MRQRNIILFLGLFFFIGTLSFAGELEKQEKSDDECVECEVDTFKDADVGLKYLLVKCLVQQGDLLNQLQTRLGYSATSNYLESPGNEHLSSPHNQFREEEFSSEFDEHDANVIIEEADSVVKEIVYSILESDIRAQQRGDIDFVCSTPRRDYIRVLFVGLPGIGKTTLAEAIACKLGRKVRIICPVSGMSKYQFCLQQYIKEQIDPLIDRDEPCVIVIDEIDQLHAYRSNENDVDPIMAITNCMDRAEKKDTGRISPHFIFLATTNHLDRIPGVLRSRLRVVEIKHPNNDLRVNIVTDLLTKLNVEEDVLNFKFMKSFAGKMKNFSIRDIKTVINVAIEIAMAEAYKKRKKEDCQSKVFIRRDHLDKAFKNIWAQTYAAEKYWLNRLKKWVTGDVPFFVKRLMMVVVESSIHSSINWLFMRSDKQREEERYQELKAREDLRYRQQNGLSASF